MVEIPRTTIDHIASKLHVTGRQTRLRVRLRYSRRDGLCREGLHRDQVRVGDNTFRQLSSGFRKRPFRRADERLVSMSNR